MTLKNILLTSLIFLISDLFGQIVSYPVNDSIIGSGQLLMDLDNDNLNDYKFQVITLAPETLAARVVSEADATFLDNSTFGYPDTLNFDDPVTGFFNSGNGVLGTFNNAGQFKGAGDKYLGIKFNNGIGSHFGWISLYCSSNNDTLIIHSIGYNDSPNGSILAGQTSLTSSLFDFNPLDELIVNQSQQEGLVNIQNLNHSKRIEFYLHDTNGALLIHEIARESIDISSYPKGVYFLTFKLNEFRSTRKLIVH